MLRKSLGALAISAAMGFCAPANASVFYNLTFENASGAVVVEGTGAINLNIATVSQASNFNSSSISTFNSLNTTAIDGHPGFSLLPSDLQTFVISTGAAGIINSLTLQENVPASNNSGNPPTNILVLDLFTNTWQIHGQFNSTVDQGRLVVTGPTLGLAGGNQSETPLPAALPLFASGAGVLGFLGWRRKRKQAA